MTARRNLDIFTSPPAFVCLCAVIIALWAAILIAPALIFASMQQQRVVAASPEAAR